MFQIAVRVSDMVLEAANEDDVQVWSSEEMLSIAAWLCAVTCTAALRRARRRNVLRTLHLLIDDVATEKQVPSAPRGAMSHTPIQSNFQLGLISLLVLYLKVNIIIIAD